MPSSNPELDALLVEFLKKDRAAADKGITLESIAVAQKNLADNVNAHIGEDRKQFESLKDTITERFLSHDRRLTKVEADLQHAENDLDRVEEITGKHDVGAILDKAAVLARGGRSTPPRSNGLAKFLSDALAKRVVQVLLLVLASIGGYVVHHLTWNAAAPAAERAK